MKKDKKFIIGIILLAIGVIGLFGIPSSDNKTSLIIGCLIILAIGGVLLYLGITTKKNITQNTQESNSQTNTISKTAPTHQFNNVDGSQPVNLLPLVQNDLIKIYEYTKPLCVIKEDENPLPYIREKVNAGERQISFTFEPDNPHDPDAIAVNLDDKKIGYVYRSQTQDMIHDYYKKGFEICAHICTFTDEEITYKIGFYKPKEKCCQHTISFKNKKFTENAIEGDIYSVYYDDVDERYMISICGEEVTLPKSAEQYAKVEYEVPVEVGENCESLIFYK